MARRIRSQAGAVLEDPCSVGEDLKCSSWESSANTGGDSWRQDGMAGHLECRRRRDTLKIVGTFEIQNDEFIAECGM